MEKEFSTNDILADVLAFNVDAYFDWLEGYFLQRPDQSEIDKAASEMWDATRTAIQNGEPIPPTSDILLELESWEKQQRHLQILEKVWVNNGQTIGGEFLETPEDIEAEEDFEKGEDDEEKEQLPMPNGFSKNLKAAISEGARGDIEMFLKKSQRGIIPAERVFDEAISEMLDVVELNVLEWAAIPFPIIEANYHEAKSTFWAVLVIQQIHQEKVSAAQTNPSPELPAPALPKPLKWTGQKNTLAAFFGELKRRKFIDAGSERMAEWVVLMFEGIGKAKDVDKDIRNPDLPKKDATTIKDIMELLTKLEAESN